MQDLGAVTGRWPTVTNSQLWFDQERGVLATRLSGRTRSALFGSGLFRAGKAAARFVKTGNPKLLFQCSPHFSSETALPHDAVILFLHEGKNGVVLASAEANLVAKLRYGEKGFQEWQRERAAIAEIEKTEAAKHIFPIIEHGITSNGCAWIVTPLAPNHHPILPNIFRGDRLLLAKSWRRFLRRRILPVLATICDQAGIEDISGENYLESTSSKIIPDDPLAARLLQKAERAYSPTIGRTPVLISRIHGDLYARHVHRSNDRWWLLDWGESVRRELFLEILDRYIRRPATYSKDSAQFWEWLNRGGNLIGEVAADISLFTNWIRDWTGVEISSEALRFQILVYLLQRIQEGRLIESASTLLNTDAVGAPISPDISNPKTILADLNLLVD